MENVLASLAVCSSYDVLIILKKKRLKIIKFNLEAIAERRTESLLKIFTKIHLMYILKGQKIDPKAVKRESKFQMKNIVK